MGIGEYGFIVMHKRDRHATRRTRRDDPLLLRLVICIDQCVGRDALRAGGDAVTQSQCFLRDGDEVRNLFESGEWGEDLCVRNCGMQLAFQSSKDSRVREEMVCCNAECPGR